MVLVRYFGGLWMTFKVKFLHAYRGHIYVLYIPVIGLSNFLYMRTGPKCEKWPKSGLQEATSDLEIEGQGHKTIAFVALPIYTHIPNLKGLIRKGISAAVVV